MESSALLGESAGAPRPFTNIYEEKEIGRFKVCCSGNLVIPNEWKGSIVSWILIIAPSLLQIFSVNSQFSLFLTIDILYLISMTLSLTFLFFTTFTDPGIIPREDPNKER